MHRAEGRIATPLDLLRNTVNTAAAYGAGYRAGSARCYAP